MDTGPLSDAVKRSSYVSVVGRLGAPDRRRGGCSRIEIDIVPSGLNDSCLVRTVDSFVHLLLWLLVREPLVGSKPWGRRRKKSIRSMGAEAKSAEVENCLESGWKTRDRSRRWICLAAAQSWHHVTLLSRLHPNSSAVIRGLFSITA